MMPFWATLRQTAWFKAVLVGLNSTAIGFIFAACILMWQSAVANAASAAAFCVAGSMALVYKVREQRGEANEAVNFFISFFISGPRFFSSLSLTRHLPPILRSSLPLLASSGGGS